MRTRPTPRALFLLLLSIPVAGCGSAAPFSVQTPGLEALQQERPYLYATPPDAMEALGGTPLPARVRNLAETYEGELQRAQRAQGGFLNTTLSLFGLVLPISGTVAAIALSDPDDVQTVSIIAGAATTAVMALNLLLKPQAKSAAAAQCASFLESALESIELRWTAPQLDALSGTPQDWNTYLTMRGTLEPGRVSACAS